MAAQSESTVSLITNGADTKAEPEGNFVRIGKRSLEMNQYFETIVIGGGQAGLSVGYFLEEQDHHFVILDANNRIGDAWRNRWDSLRLFTPSHYDALPGMPFPSPARSLPTKDEMADYLEAYARRFHLPVRTGVKVDRVWKQNGRFMIAAGSQCFEAEQVVVAMSNLQKPRIPPYASQLNPSIVQLSAANYRNPSQLQPGAVLVVGAGNSGADIAMDVAAGHTTWLSGRDTGTFPFAVDGIAAYIVSILLYFAGDHILTVKTPLGRKVRAKFLPKGKPVERVKPADLAAAGVVRVPRVEGVENGLPVLADQQVLDVANIIWCTGFHEGFEWIDIPSVGMPEPVHEHGVAVNVPGLYFVGLEFLYSLTSSNIHGVGRDARYIARQIAIRSKVHTKAIAEDNRKAGTSVSMQE
jgi:putative flavoprotein involved in K+ transport